MTDSTTTPTDRSALTKRVLVPCPPDRAFDLFTRRMTAWWPLGTHSVGGQRVVAVAVDGRAGGHIVETLDDGSTALWGTVTAWAPPGRFALDWHPGGDPEEATRACSRRS